MSNLSALLSGLTFGIGLILSGMTEPQKVLGFLDVAGLWDPSLAFVMAGAVGVAAIAFAIARQRAPAAIPAGAGSIDRRLLLGATLFGAGWGLAGICPGPAIVLLGTGSVEGSIFAAGMLGGMLLFRLLEKHERCAAARHTAPPTTDATHGGARH